MKVQFSKERRMKDLPSMWMEDLPTVDMHIDVIEPGNFPFNKERVETIYDFGALGMCPQDKIVDTLMHWLRALKSGSSIFITEVDFEKMVRAYTGGDISVHDFNNEFNRRTHLTANYIAECAAETGIPQANVKRWEGGHTDFDPLPCEFVVQIIKP